MHCGSEVICRFRVCGSFDRLLPGKLEVIQCLQTVSAATVVMSQLSVVIFQPRIEETFDLPCRALMQALASFHQWRTVCHLLSERMFEGGRRFRKGRLLIDEFAELKGRKHAFQFFVGLSYDTSYQSEREFLADHRERLQEPFLVHGQTIDSRGQDSLYRRRDVDLGR